MARLAARNEWSHGSDGLFSHRAMKYLGAKQSYLGNQKKVQDAWKKFDEIANALEQSLAQVLHNDMKEMVDKADEYIRFLAEDGFKQESRSKATIHAQLRRVWATPAGDEFIAKRAADRRIETVEDAMNCLREEWDWPTGL